MHIPPLLVALLCAALLALGHVLAPALRFLGGTPRSIWLSVAGGVSVAYVFVHLLPELAAGQAQVSRAIEAAPASLGGVGRRFAERHVYLIALVGLAVFYGLDKLALRSRGRGDDADEADGDGEGQPGGRARDTPGEDTTTVGVFWVHMASFGVYNVLVGYLLLHRERPDTSDLLLFAVAMALHFLVTDRGLEEHHQTRYRRTGRWLLAAAVWVGVGVGAATEIPAAALAVFVAFLAGGVILNVLKEEMPSERRGRFWAFTLGMAVYSALLLAL